MQYLIRYNMHHDLISILIKVIHLVCLLIPVLFSQSSINLPPDKLKLLSQYDNEKKWELVCDQVRF